VLRRVPHAARIASAARTSATQRRVSASRANRVAQGVHTLVCRAAPAGKPTGAAYVPIDD
jgi:hypothetical protein